MRVYKKIEPRLKVQFYDNETEELLFEVNDRNHLNVGEIFSDIYVSRLINQQGCEPDEVFVMVSSVYE